MEGAACGAFFIACPAWNAAKATDATDAAESARMEN
jgi:hypothetical protein